MSFGIGPYNIPDDGYAILLCLYADKVSEMDLLGITTDAGGNTNVDQGVACALKLLEMAGREDIPVYRGVDKPLVSDNVPLFGPNGEVEEPYGGWAKIKEAQDQDAVDFIIEQVMKYPGEVTLMPIGSLTNIAMAIRKKPEIVPMIKQIISMGGEFNGCFYPGGANWFFDPHATYIVLHSGIPLTIVPTDTTTKNKFTMSQLDSIDNIKQSEFGQWIRTATEYSFAFDAVEDENGLIYTNLHDPIAVAVFLDPTIAVETVEMYVDTVIDGPWAGLTVGQRLTSLYPPPKGVEKSKVVFEHDESKFIDLILKAVQTLIK